MDDVTSEHKLVCLSVAVVSAVPGLHRSSRLPGDPKPEAASARQTTRTEW